MKQPKKEKKESKSYLILKGFSYENSNGEAVYVPKLVHINSGHRENNIADLPKEAIELGKKLKAIKAV